MSKAPDFPERFYGTPLEAHREILMQLISKALDPAKNIQLESWNQWIAALPVFQPKTTKLNAPAIMIGARDEIPESDRLYLETELKKFHPWRKGPYSVFGIDIDTEWRSDLKWDRLKNSIKPLTGKTVLDVGCGNGYHCWRMAGTGAENVIGLEPFLLSVAQFRAIDTYLRSQQVNVLPLGIEDFPQNTGMFDSVFSMGVLYHRRSPMDHLLELRGQLKSGGELILETLVIDGAEGAILVPEDRYAKMRNVWFLPSCLTLESWLRKCKYKNIRMIDKTKTTVREQRTTEWMQFESLPDFLNPVNPEKTLEGHPAPQRAIFLAEAP